MTDRPSFTPGPMRRVLGASWRIVRVALMLCGVVLLLGLVAWHYTTRDFDRRASLPPEESRPIPAGAQVGDAPPKEQVVRIFEEVFATKDVPTLAAYYHRDAVLQDTWARCEGTDCIWKYYTMQFKYADVIHLKVMEYLQQGNRVMLRFHGVQRTKDPAIDIDLYGAMYLEFLDGKIWYQREYWDGMTFLDNVPVLNRLFRSIRYNMGEGAISGGRG